MADVNKTVEIIFGATDRTGGALRSVGEGLQSVESRVGSVTGPLSDVTDKIQALAAASIAAGAALVGFSVNEAGRFGDAVNEINTLLDISPQNFAEFRDEILEYSRSSTQSIEDINAAVYSAISAGVDYQRTLEVLNQSEQLAVASKAGLQETMVVLASTMNAYGAESSEAKRYSDSLFTTVRLGQTTFDELAATLSRVTGIAAAGEVPIETLTAAIAELTAQGDPTSQAITGLKAALSNIIKPSKEASEKAQELGINFNATALQSRGLEGVLVDIYAATSGNVEEMAALFGSVEALNAVLKLTRDGASGFLEKLAEMRNSTGATAVAYAKMADNFALVNQGMLNNMRATLIEIGDRLLDDYKDVAIALGNLFEATSVSIDAGAFDPVFEVLRAFGDNLEETLNTIAANLPEALAQVDWSELTAAMEGLGLSVASLFDGIDISTPEGLAAAIQSIVDTGASLTFTLKGMVEALKDFIDNAIIPAIREYNSLDVATKENIGSTLQWAKNIDQVLPVVGGLGSAIETLGYWIGALSFSNLITGATGFTGALGGMSGAARGLLPLLGRAGLYGAIAALGVGLGALAEETTGVGSALNDALAPDWIFNRGATIGTVIADLVDYLSELGNESDEVTAAFERQAAQLKRDAQVLDEFKQAHQELKDLMHGVSEEEKNLIDSEEELNSLQADIITKAKERGIAAKDLGIDIKNTADATETLADKTAQVNKIFDESGNVIGYADGVRGVAAAYTEVAKKAEDAEKKSDDFLVKMEEIASNERIKVIEAKVQLDIAKIEADKEKIIASFDSISRGIESTGQVLSDLFGVWSDATTQRDKWTAEKWIEREQDRRDDQFRSQKELIDAQIDEIEARTRRYQDGMAEIIINGDGLEPELEAFMFQILKRLQIKMAAEQAAFLTGLPA